MPIKKNAKKALRQAEKRALANKVVRDAYKEAMKQANKAIENGKDAVEAARLVQQKLGKAAKKGVIKSNTAARKLSRLMKKINAKKPATETKPKSKKKSA
jgi:small subunit ribosomal protein S20